MRRILRSVKVPPTQFPDRFRASTLGWWFWCAERSRHYALNLLPPKPKTIQSKHGTELHDEILTRQFGERDPWEDEFIETLEQAQDPKFGFSRKIGDTKIYANITGHPDDFRISLDGDVTIIEHKTTEIDPKKGLKFIEHYKLPMAEFQIKIYAWIFDDLFRRKKELRVYRLARTHTVMFWHVNHKKNTCQLIDWYPFTYYPTSVETDIKYALAAYKKPEMILPPRSWKCKQCPKVNREICRFHGQTNKT